MQDAQNKSVSSAPSGNANADGVVGDIDAQAMLASAFAVDGGQADAAREPSDGGNGGGTEHNDTDVQTGGGETSDENGASRDGTGESDGDGASGEGGEQGGQDGGNADDGAGNPFERSARGWQKRVDKLTAQKKAKDDRIRELESEIEALKSGRSEHKHENTQQENPVERIATVEELDKYAADTRAERDKVLALLSSPDPDFEIGGQVYTREQVAGYLKILNADLDERIPAKRGQLSFGSALAEKAKENDALIAKTFPDFKEGSAEDEWINEQLSDKFFEANKKVLLHYAWRGLAASKIEAKYREKRAGKGAARTIPPAAPSDSAQVAQKPDAFNEDGSVKLDFASKMFD